MSVLDDPQVTLVVDIKELLWELPIHRRKLRCGWHFNSSEAALDMFLVAGSMYDCSHDARIWRMVCD